MKRRDLRFRSAVIIVPISGNNVYEAKRLTGPRVIVWHETVMPVLSPQVRYEAGGERTWLRCGPRTDFDPQRASQLRYIGATVIR